MRLYTVFYAVPGKYTASTVVEASSKEAAAIKVNGVYANGAAVVKGVMRGR